MSVSWNGSAVSNRDVIFHDEVSKSTLDSNLICQSSTTVPNWHYPNGTVVGPFSANRDDYVQIPIPQQRDVDLLRNKDAAEINPLNNGLWTCRLGDLFIPVGIYPRRGEYIICKVGIQYICIARITPVIANMQSPKTLAFMQQVLP